jgi:RimJ/RimL family protein N-acetyltransferase
MKRVVWDEAERVGEWVCERLGSHFHPKLSTAIGLESEGKLVAGVLFDNYLHNSIAMHVAGDGGHWMTREFALACFGYAFNQLKVFKILGYVDSANTAARRYDEHLGFRLEYSIAGAGKHGDLCIYSMTRDQCRFLEQKNGYVKLAVSTAT